MVLLQEVLMGAHSTIGLIPALRCVIVWAGFDHKKAV